MTAVFTWKAQVDTTGSGQFDMFSSKFGDGYSQEIPNGLNNETQSWSVNVAGYKAVVSAALTFIRAQKGQSFFWTPPFGTQGYYKCKKYSSLSDAGGGYWSINLEFEQGYAP